MQRIDQYMNNLYYWAHTQKGKPEETLAAHSRLCLQYYCQYCKKKKIDILVKRIIAQCGCDKRETDDIYQLFVDAVYYHDIGKINPAYQYRVLHNPHFPVTHNSSHHAILSAYIYMCEHLEAFSRADIKKFSYFLFAFSYSIARHHGYLNDIADFKDKLQDCIETEGCYAKKLDLEKNSIFTVEKGYDRLKKIIADEAAFYILNKVLFGVITACDYCATAEYMNGVEAEINVIDNLDGLRSRYFQGELYSGIRRYQDNHTVFAGSINEQRCRIFLEAEENLRDNPSACMYYLEAPTGSGKTNVSINLFLTMLEQDRELTNVFYIFPFNTLVEQTADSLKKYFTYGKDMVVVNSLAPIYVEAPIRKTYSAGPEELNYCDYEKAVWNKVFNNYPIVVTSHVNFFNALFGTGREQSFPLVKLCNSVVIIDEIQSYRNSIWWQIILFLSKYADLLHIKIVIMSATLPRLDLLLEKQGYNIVDLLKDPQVYYRSSFFKNRVELDFSLLAYKKIDLSTLLAKVLEYKSKKVLVEFISKTTAREFFTMLCQQEELYCIEITGDDNAKNRKSMIQEIKSRESIVVVATQVIEAGVDIDMDIGFKDISLPDAEEQFLGRINRSCLKKGCKAYFFNYDDAQKIYRDDERIHYPITDPHIGELLKNKDFKGIYELVLHDVKVKGERLTRKDSIQFTYKNCLELNYREIEQKMRLIPPAYQIFLAYELAVDGEILSGRRVWEQYKNLCLSKDMGYGEKKVRLSEMAEKISYFTYTVYSNDQQTLSCDEEFGGYYYIENGEQFIEDGKFNRKAFQNSSKGLFL